ncbi:CD99 antigen-like protein 2, partial [Centroberyx affinis]|uniref:CD99 antigen-like protein 2 n=1 Tax=Centroberyx affinis TaxID=166261 RepID=UPI003A5C3201
MGNWSVWSLCLLLSALPLEVLSQDGFDLSDALGGDDSKAPTPSPKPALPAGGAGTDLDLNDFFDDGPTTTKAPPKVAPKATKAPAKPKPKP